MHACRETEPVEAKRPLSVVKQAVLECLFMTVLVIVRSVFVLHKGKWDIRVSVNENCLLAEGPFPQRLFLRSLPARRRTMEWNRM